MRTRSVHSQREEGRYVVHLRGTGDKMIVGNDDRDVWRRLKRRERKERKKSEERILVAGPETGRDREH